MGTAGTTTPRFWDLWGFSHASGIAWYLIHVASCSTFSQGNEKTSTSSCGILLLLLFCSCPPCIVCLIQWSCCSDLYVYDTTKQRLHMMCADTFRVGGPEPGFTQRANFDADAQEMCVLAGLSRDVDSQTNRLKNSCSFFFLHLSIYFSIFLPIHVAISLPDTKRMIAAVWVFSVRSCKWEKVYENTISDPRYWKEMQYVEPCPRFAHQFEFDPVDRVYYLHGGNAGDMLAATERLADLWTLKIRRPSVDTVVQQALFCLRKQQYVSELPFFFCRC